MPVESHWTLIDQSSSRLVHLITSFSRSGNPLGISALMVGQHMARTFRLHSDCPRIGMQCKGFVAFLAQRVVHFGYIMMTSELSLPESAQLLASKLVSQVDCLVLSISEMMSYDGLN